MSINNFGSSAFDKNIGLKTVGYKPYQSGQESPVSFGKTRIPLKAQPIKPSGESAGSGSDTSKKEDTVSKKEDDDRKKTDDKKNNINDVKQVSESPSINDASETMNEISFVTMPFSRDFILYQDGKPAYSKTYHFNFQGDTFPGAVTDSEGRLFLYDQSGDFHRPLKTLQKRGDPHSAFHAGFLEISPDKKHKGNYADLGNIEVLQAALQSSRDGKYAIKITQNDSFLTNWMHATSSDQDERGLYWVDNMVKLPSKLQQKLINYALPAAAIAVPLASLIALGTAYDKADDYQGDVNKTLAQKDNFDPIELSRDANGNIIARFDDATILPVDAGVLQDPQAQQIGLDPNSSAKVSVRDGVVYSADKAVPENTLTLSEVNNLNNAHDLQKLESKYDYKAPDLNEAEKIALATFITGTLVGGGAYAYSTLKDRKKLLDIHSRSANLKQKKDDYSDDFVQEGVQKS